MKRVDMMIKRVTKTKEEKQKTRESRSVRRSKVESRVM